MFVGFFCFSLFLSTLKLLPLMLFGSFWILGSWLHFSFNLLLSKMLLSLQWSTSALKLVCISFKPWGIYWKIWKIFQECHRLYLKETLFFWLQVHAEFLKNVSIFSYEWNGVYSANYVFPFFFFCTEDNCGVYRTTIYFYLQGAEH